MDSVKYSYNIRNQLTKIKSLSFEENMYYYTNNPYNSNGVPCYNGNISSSTWTYGNKTNGYNYFYDNLNRLTSEYSILNGIFSDYAYTEYFVYDKHGNITQLYRWNSEDIMDGLEMTYNGNKLKAVSNENQMVLPSYNAKHYQNLSNVQTEFEYDNNGNLVKDYDRNICKIQYNSLNLPTRIQFRNGNQIAHLYDAAGDRVKTTYYTRKSAVVVPFGNMLYPENNISDYNVVQYAYNGNISYKRSGANSQWMLDLIRNPEGYNRFYTQTEHYPFYYIKDHLGNIRELWVYPGDNYNELVQRMQYYPSGLPWDTNISPGEQPYKYNGKEFIEMHGLDEYDSKARWYYPAIARTSTMDPLCENYYDISPYAWCGNNFVKVIDLNGKDWYEDEDGNIIYTDLKSQEELDESDTNGTYLGETYVLFEGSDDESWGEDLTLSGANANPAQVTIYGINGADDIKVYSGMTIPQSEQYSTLNAGDYLAYYQDMASSVYGTKGALEKGYAPALTYRIQTLDKKEILRGKKNGQETLMTAIFMHRTDWNGKASKSSKGCLIIDGRRWREVEKQIGKSHNIYIRVHRKNTK